MNLVWSRKMIPMRAGVREVMVSKRAIPQRKFGPTPERLAKAQGFVEVGDDKRGGKIYTFRDSTMDRLYIRLVKAAKTRYAEDELRREYTALMKYKHHWHSAGLEPSIGSVDLNRVFASDPGSMSGMSKTEIQAHHRRQYREAGKHICEWFGSADGHKAVIILDNVVCYGNELVVAGYATGYASPFRARKGAVDILRESGQALSGMWGIG